MHTFKSLSLICLILALISGCVVTVHTDDFEDDDGWRSRQTKNERVIKRLDLGRSQSSIEGELGEPDFVESFSRNGDTYKVLYYRTERRHDDGRTTRDETTPLVFIDSELVGWGESAIENATAPRHSN